MNQQELILAMDLRIKALLARAKKAEKERDACVAKLKKVVAVIDSILVE